MINKYIYVLNAQHLSQIKTLPKSWISDGVRYNLTWSDKTILPEFPEELKPDLVVDVGVGDRLVADTSPILLSGNHVIRLARHSKLEQMRRFKAVVGTFPAEKAYPLAYQLLEFNGRRVGELSIRWSRHGYVLRPAFGARSIGIFELRDPETLRGDLEAIHEAVNLRQPPASNDYFNNRFRLIGFSELVRDGEISEVMQRDPWILTERVPRSNRTEYRVIFNGVNFLWVDRNGSEVNRPDNYQEIERTLYLLQPVGSFDVWVRKDLGDDTISQWGIFEFQPQYSHEEFPEAEHSAFLKDFFENQINYLSNEIS